MNARPLIPLELALIGLIVFQGDRLSWWADICQAVTIILLCLPQWKRRKRDGA
jgi:hypothetical protein